MLGYVNCPVYLIYLWIYPICPKRKCGESRENKKIKIWRAYTIFWRVANLQKKTWFGESRFGGLEKEITRVSLARGNIFSQLFYSKLIRMYNYHRHLLLHLRRGWLVGWFVRPREFFSSSPDHSFPFFFLHRFPFFLLFFRRLRMRRKRAFSFLIAAETPNFLSPPCIVANDSFSFSFLTTLFAN